MKVGFTCSSFDLLHSGHITMLEECADNCDKLIIGLNVNPCKRGKYPVQNVVERYVQLKALRYVDEIIPYNTEEELVDLLQLMRPDIRFIGDDYKGKTFTGDELSIEVFYNTREHRFSSSELKERTKDVLLGNILDGRVVKDNDTYTIIDNNELEKLTVSTTTLHPEQSTSGHKHPGIEEVYHFISGSGTMKVGDNAEQFVYARQTVVIPDGDFHQVHNTSSEEDLVFICTFNDQRNH